MNKLTKIALYSLLLPGILILMAEGCRKKSDTSPASTTPVLTTAAVTDITMTTANSGGNVTSPGGSIVTEWGICWSKSANPTISDAKCGGGASTTNFTCGMTGLDMNTLYYVRAYAKNSSGIAYGDQKSFTTLSFTNPVFSVRSVLNTSSFSLTFFAKCTNDDVKMTKVLITDPDGVSTWTYMLNGTTYVRNQEFGLQDAGHSYDWLTGHWTFEFIGTRVTNGESFDITITLFV
jgi:hypothetical protein